DGPVGVADDLDLDGLLIHDGPDPGVLQDLRGAPDGPRPAIQAGVPRAGPGDGAHGEVRGCCSSVVGGYPDGLGRVEHERQGETVTPQRPVVPSVHGPGYVPWSFVEHPASFGSFGTPGRGPPPLDVGH